MKKTSLLEWYIVSPDNHAVYQVELPKHDCLAARCRRVVPSENDLSKSLKNVKMKCLAILIFTFAMHNDV